MNDDGYTLVEMLVALVLASLAVTAVTMTARMVSRTEGQLQSGHATSVSLGRFSHAASAALRDAGPFATAGAAAFEGSPDGARFDCGEGRCALEAAPTKLRFTRDDTERSYAVPRLSRPGLLYVSATDGRAFPHWPPADRADRLAMVVVADAGRPVLNLAVGREQPASCIFDASANDCAGQVGP